MTILLPGERSWPGLAGASVNTFQGNRDAGPAGVERVLTTPAAMRGIADKFACEESLATFMREAWPWSREPDEYLTNWHIDCMCDYLTAAIDWQLGNILIFTLPPGHMKSLGINVFLPAWLWAQDPKRGHPNNTRALRPNSWRGPGARMIFMGYQEKLMIQHAEKSLNLIESPWYQARWQNRFAMAREGVEEFNNDKGGLRQAMSSKGGITGFGSHIIGLDDVHNRAAATYEVDRIRMIDTWGNAMQSRLRDIHGLFLLSMQRIAINDLIGHILAKEFGGIHVCLPYEKKANHPFLFMRDLDDAQKRVCGALLDKPVIRKTRSDDNDCGPAVGEVWQDTRAEGQVLWEAKWPKAFIDARTKDMTTPDREAQYQQNPEQSEGNLFKRVWFEHPVDVGGDYYSFAEARRLSLVRAWDLAWTEKKPGKAPDWTVGVLMGHDRESDLLYILDVVRGQWGPADVERIVKSTARRDGVTTKIRIPQDPAAGTFVAAYMRTQLLKDGGYTVLIEREQTSKGQRAAPVAGRSEHRLLVLVKGDWNKVWIDEHCAYRPELEDQVDDQVDATSAAFRVHIRMPTHAGIGA